MTYVYAGAVETDTDTVVGHLPRKVSVACSLFMHRNGVIVYEITGKRLVYGPTRFDLPWFETDPCSSVYTTICCIVFVTIHFAMKVNSAKCH